MNPDVFSTWLANAQPGETIEYYRGSLISECDRQASSLDDWNRSQLMTTRKLAWQAASSGCAHLVQRKCGFNDYAYLAIARSPS